VAVAVAVAVGVAVAEGAGVGVRVGGVTGGTTGGLVPIGPTGASPTDSTVRLREALRQLFVSRRSFTFLAASAQTTIA
jgi:hypothetical protein